MRPSANVIFVKRIVDVAVGLAGTLAFLFFYPILALLIKLESKGPVIYRQERIGINKRLRREQGGNDDSEFPGRRSDVGGKPFHIYKFRSMRTDAEKNGPQFAAKGVDPRVTKVGWWLRALHLDELPQFWSVLKGDMSFIGPRPERAHFTVQFGESIPHYKSRTLFVKPGLTGLAQITLGADDGMESVVRKTYFDYSYRASFSHFRSWARLEWWILMNTVFYLMIKPRKEGDTRDLGSLKRVKLLGLLARAPLKPQKHHVTAWVKLNESDRSVVIEGREPADIMHKLDRLASRGLKTLEVCYTPAADFDLEDLGFLVELAHRVKGEGGRLSLRDSDPRVRRMLQEIHMDKVIEMGRAATQVPNFLTVDVECWFHAYNLKEKAPPSTWHMQETRIVDNMERILNLTRAHGVKATFFVLGWVADHFPEVVRMIAADGHEIGTHGYYHNLITDLTPASFEEDLLKSLEAISRHAPGPIIGHRASNFTIVPSTYWALEILARHGLKYDSSIFPIKRDRYGIPHYPNRLPHVLHLKSGKTLGEFPMSTLGVGNKFLPMSGGGYLRLFPHAVTEMFIESRNRKGHPAMVYFHPWEVDSDQARVSVGMVKTFQHYVNLHTLEWKLNRLMQKFSFVSIRDAMEERRVQVLLRRNPVYIPSHMGHSWESEKKRPEENLDAPTRVSAA
jgi:polysaccharide deacetylase family protein (PEP-CTERM system associated)